MKGKIMLVVQILIQGLNVKSMRGFFRIFKEIQPLNMPHKLCLTLFKRSLSILPGGLFSLTLYFIPV